VRGRPAPRCEAPSYFWAISLRCQASKVSGVTMPAACVPGLGGQATPLVVIQSQAPIAKLLAEYAVFLAEIFDHLLLGLIHPSGHRDEQEAKGIEDFSHPLFIIVEHGMVVG